MGLHDRDWYHEAIDEKNGKKPNVKSHEPSQGELMEIQRKLSKINYFKPTPARKPLWKLLLEVTTVLMILAGIAHLIIKAKTG